MDILNLNLFNILNLSLAKSVPEIKILGINFSIVMHRHLIVFLMICPDAFNSH